LASSLFASQIAKMGKDVSVNSMMPADNPNFIYAEKMKDLFGATDQFVIGNHFKDSVYTVANLTLIKGTVGFYTLRRSTGCLKKSIPI
jgi:hypothetical protein